ncbi:MAG: Soluble lytic murein transglycosylase precursor [bacterium ADurb.BinA186]|nr:MAG: Soluble lytic murein transglycosylase precursor [bacterium ADurb.BinA186]
MAQLFVDLNGPEMGYQKLIQCGSRAGHILKERPGLYRAIAFPKPYVVEVREATQKADMPPNLIYAIMRRESGYLKDARSWAQARGLMQMMKKTADEQAKKLGIKLESEEDLHKPELNLLLGATLIRDLLGKFNNLAIALSAYNAGPGAAQTWIKKNDQAPVDAYLETISFDETNKYLKYVLEGLFNYSLLEGNKSLSLLDFYVAKK